MMATAKPPDDLLAMERDAKFNAWLQRKAILDNAHNFLKKLDSDRGRSREDTLDIAVSLQAVDKLLEHASKNVETTMNTVKSTMEQDKDEKVGDKAVVDLPASAPWRPAGGRQSTSRMPPALITSRLSINAKKGDKQISMESHAGCMKGQWVQLGAGTTWDLCKIASSNATSVVLYEPGVRHDHAADAVVKVFPSDCWKALTEAHQSQQGQGQGGAATGEDETKDDDTGHKSMKHAWIRWAMEHHRLDADITKEELNKFSEGVRENMYRDPTTGEIEPKLSSLQYAFPKGAKPLFPSKREEEQMKKKEKQDKQDKKESKGGPPAQKKSKEEVEAEEKLKKRGGLTDDAMLKNEIFLRELKKMWAEAGKGLRGLVEANVKVLQEKRKAKQQAEADGTAAAAADGKNGRAGGEQKAGEKEEGKGAAPGQDSKETAAAAKGGAGGVAESKGEAKPSGDAAKGGGAGAGDDKSDSKADGTGAGAGAGAGVTGSTYAYTYSKMELFVFHDLALRRLKDWADDDEDKWMKEVADKKKEEDDERKQNYSSYVRRKDMIRIRLPDAADLEHLPKPKMPSMEFRMQVTGRPKSAPAAKPSTLDILAGSGLKYVYAHHPGQLTADNYDKFARKDLERCRAQLEEAGILYKENFDDEKKYKTNQQGEYVNDYNEIIDLQELTKFPLGDLRDKRERLAAQRQRQVRAAEEDSRRAYQEWVEVKAMKDQALRALALLAPPVVPFSFRAFMDTAAADEKRSRDLLDDKGLQLVLKVGAALKRVDRTLLSTYASWCEKVGCPKPQPGEAGFTGNEKSAKQPNPPFFPSFGVVQALWDAFEPVGCDVHCASYSQVRDAFLKLMRPGLDYRQTFNAFADRLLGRAVRAKMARMSVDKDRRDQTRDRLMAEERRTFALSKEDMEALLREMGVVMGDHEMGQLVRAFDADGDGRVTLEEFLDFTGPKREKCGGTLLAINTRAVCCWHSTCQVTGMPNAYADATKGDKRHAAGVRASTTSLRRSLDPRDRDRDREDGKSDDDDSRAPSVSASQSLSIGGGHGPRRVERTMGTKKVWCFEMGERARREDWLVKLGVVPARDDRDNPDYGDDDDSADDDYGDDGDFDDSRHGSPKRAKRKKRASCGMARWTVDARKKGLQYLSTASKVAQEEQRISQMLASGKPPEGPRMWNGGDAPHSATEVRAWACTELLVNWGPAQDRGDFITFFSLEFGGPIGSGGGALSRATYRKIARDPVDAEPDSDFTFSHRVKDLQPGTSYAFRIRAFNGYGPGEYTYKVLTTRPAKVTRPAVTAVTAESVALRWQFSALFVRRREELQRVFDLADADRSGRIDRAELAHALSGDGDGDASVASPDLLSFLALRARALGLGADLSARGLGALFDLVEGDDDGLLSWKEFEAFFMGAGWASYTGHGGGDGGGNGSSSNARSPISSVEDGVSEGKGRPGDVTYVVERCVDDQRQAFTEVLRTSLGHAAVHRLEPGTSYKFRVHALNVDGHPGPASAPVVVQTRLETPPTPLVVLSSISDHSVALKWKRRHEGQGSKTAGALKRLQDDWVGAGYGGEGEGDGGVSLDKAFSRVAGNDDDLTVETFGALLAYLGVEATDERVREAFYGTERQDALSFSEFMTWWLQHETTYVIKRSDPIVDALLAAASKRQQPSALARAEGSTRSSLSFAPQEGDRGGAVRYRLATAADRQSSVASASQSDRPLTGNSSRLLQPTVASANSTKKAASAGARAAGADLAVAMPWVSYRGPGNKCEIRGLQPNTLYHFKLRFTSCRSHSDLSSPLVLMTAPAAPSRPPIVTAPVGMNTVRVKMYPPDRHGAYKFLLQLKKCYGPSGRNNPRAVGAIGDGGKGSGKAKSRGGPPDHTRTSRNGSSSGSTLTSSSGVGRVDLLDDLSVGGHVAANAESFLHEDGWTSVYFGHHTLWCSTTLASESDYECRYLAVNRQGSVSAPSPVLSFTTAHRTSKATETLLSPKHAAGVFTQECTGDICVGDTIVMTERLYYKDRRNADMQQMQMLPASDEGRGDDPFFAEGDGAATVTAVASASGAFIGERTIAAYVVKDDYRSSRDRIAALGLTPRDVRKFGAHRRLWLEVVWQRNSHEACRPYELKPGSIIERDQSHLEEFEVFRSPWPADMERLRLPLSDEWALLKDCYH